MQGIILHTKGSSLMLDKSVLKWLGKQKELLAGVEGDSLIIKKSHSLLDFAQKPGNDYLSMQKVNREIHKSRCFL